MPYRCSYLAVNMWEPAHREVALVSKSTSADRVDLPFAPNVVTLVKKFFNTVL